MQCDIEKEGFGLEENSRNILLDEVNVFFHCAATLRFNEELRLVFKKQNKEYCNCNYDIYLSVCPSVNINL